MNSKVEIPTFDGTVTRYCEFRQLVTSVIEAEGLDLQRFNTQLAQEDGANDNDLWLVADRRKLAQLSGVIRTKLRGGALAHSMGIATGSLHTLIRELDRVYNGQARATRLQALRELVFGTFSADAGIENFIRDKTNIFERRLMGRLDADELQILSIAGNLPPQYHPVVAPLLQREDLTLQELRRSLAEHSALLQLQNASNTENVTVNNIDFQRQFNGFQQQNRQFQQQNRNFQQQNNNNNSQQQQANFTSHKGKGKWNHVKKPFWKNKFNGKGKTKGSKGDNRKGGGKHEPSSSSGTNRGGA